MSEKKKPKMVGKNLSDEVMRIYSVYNLFGEEVHSITITTPKLLFWKPGHSFHRIFDGAVVHLAPAPGVLYNHSGTIVGYVEMFWEPKDKKDPVAF